MRLVSGDWAALGQDATQVRTEVFVGEQGIPAQLEWDAADAHCLHCVAYDGEHAVGTGRLLPDAHIGRMAVLAPYRRTGIGGRILGALVAAARERGEAEVVLSAQTYVADFYRHHGFEARGEPYDEVGIPHQEMALSLHSANRQGGDAPREDSGHVSVRDTSELFVRQWRPATDSGRGVYLLHGLGEHIGRHDALARWFCARGWHVRGHDHVGHGRSSGRRGVVARRDQMLEHALELIEELLARAGATSDRRGPEFGRRAGRGAGARAQDQGRSDVAQRARLRPERERAAARRGDGAGTLRACPHAG